MSKLIVPVVILFGNASPFSKNWYRPFAGAGVSDSAGRTVLNRREGTATVDRVNFCSSISVKRRRCLYLQPPRTMFVSSKTASVIIAQKRMQNAHSKCVWFYCVVYSSKRKRPINITILFYLLYLDTLMFYDSLAPIIIDLAVFTMSIFRPMPSLLS